MIHPPFSAALLALRSWIQEALIPKAMQKTLITQAGSLWPWGSNADQYPKNPRTYPTVNIKAHQAHISGWFF